MLAHLCEKTRREQRMTAKICEEIGIKWNWLRRQHGLRRDEQLRLDVVARLLLLLGHVGWRAQRRLLEQVAVDLARRQPRQFIHGLVARRHHVGRQLLPQRQPRLARVEARAIGVDDEGDELVESIVVAQHDGRVGDARQFRQLRLDLAKLDAKAADLDLIVNAATKGDVPLRVDEHRVARAIKHGIGAIAGEGIGDEFLGRQFVALEIAARHAGAADQQLALDARAQQVQRVVDDVTGVVRNRLADRHGLAGAHDRRRRDHGRLGWSVGVEDRPAGTAPAFGDRGRAGLAAEQDDAQRRDVARQHGEQRRHRVEHGDAGLLHQVGQVVGLAHHRRRRDKQRRADEIGNPDFLHRQIEGDRGALEHHILCDDAIDLVRRTQEMTDVPPGDDDALGRAGRTGRIDHVGGMLRRRAHAARIDDRMIGGVDQFILAGDVAVDAPLGAGDLRRAGNERAGFRVGEAGGDTIERRVGVEGQPRGAGLGDADLRDQQVRPARHPQPDHVTGANALAHEAAGDARGALVDLGVGQHALGRDHARRVGTRGGGRAEDFAQQFVAQQGVVHRAAQDRPGGRLRRGVVDGHRVVPSHCSPVPWAPPAPMMRCLRPFRHEPRLNGPVQRS